MRFPLSAPPWRQVGLDFWGKVAYALDSASVCTDHRAYPASHMVERAGQGSSPERVSLRRVVTGGQPSEEAGSAWRAPRERSWSPGARRSTGAEDIISPLGRVRRRRR